MDIYRLSEVFDWLERRGYRAWYNVRPCEGIVSVCLVNKNTKNEYTADLPYESLHTLYDTMMKWIGEHVDMDEKITDRRRSLHDCSRNSM